jgi:hypothetical protein
MKEDEVQIFTGLEYPSQVRSIHLTTVRRIAPFQIVGYITKDERVADPVETILAEFIFLAKLLVKGKSIDVWGDTAMKGGVEVRDRFCIGKLLHCGANQRDGGVYCAYFNGSVESLVEEFRAHNGARSDKLSR